MTRLFTPSGDRASLQRGLCNAPQAKFDAYGINAERFALADEYDLVASDLLASSVLIFTYDANGATALKRRKIPPQRVQRSQRYNRLVEVYLSTGTDYIVCVSVSCKCIPSHLFAFDVSGRSSAKRYPALSDRVRM